MNVNLAINGLTAKKLAKPKIGKRTTLGQAFDEFYKTSLPINHFCNQQKLKLKNKSL